MGSTRIQLCGPLVARAGGERIEGALPGRQGRLAFAYLVLHRRRAVSRVVLAEAIWDDDRPPSADGSLSALVSKLRRLLPLEGRQELRLLLPPEAWVDVEAAGEALHRGEAAVAREDWAEAWGPARVAQHVAARTFLAGETAAWVEEERRRIEELHVRALELAGRACLGIGGAELPTAERAARELVRRAPLRESGHRLFMEVLAAAGNRAEALAAYDALRWRLRDELGVAPDPETQALHRRLIV